MSRSIVRLVVLAVAAVFVTGAVAAKEKREDVFAEYKENRPAAAYEATGNADVDKVGRDVAALYGSTTKILDDYVAAVEGHPTYVKFTNEMAGKTEEETTKCFDGLTPEQQADIRAVQALDGFKALEKVAPMVPPAEELSKSAAGCSGAFKGFDPTALKKVKSAKNMVNQANYTVKTLKFLAQQYATNQRLKKYEGK
jgi:hypothetical protein